MYLKEITKKHAETKLYGNIGTWYANGDSFSELLEHAELRKFEELTIRMHCFGGSVIEGTAMYNAMQRSPLKINIIIDGVAASMACFILPAIENVSISDNAYGMIHRPSCTGNGDADSFLQTAKLLQDMEANFIRQLSERTKMTEADIKAKWFDGKNHWLNASEMVQYGLAKNIVPATAKNIKDLNKEVLTGMNIEGVYDKYAACLNIELNNENQNFMKKQLIETFGLVGVTAESTDEAVMQKVKEKFSENESRLQAIEAEAKTKRDTAVKAMLDKAGVPVDQRATYEKIGETVGVEAVALALGNKTAATTPIAQMIVPGSQGGDATEPKTFDELVAKGEAFITTFKAETPDKYKALYKAEYGHEPRS